MKKIYYYFALPLLCCLFIACGSDDDEDEKNKELIVELTTENLTDDGYFDGLLYYQILPNSPKQAEVKKALKSCQVVKVPDKIKIGNDVYSIVQVGENAFNGCKSLVSIELPNSLTNIGYEAFEGCDGLTSVHVSNISAWCKIDFAYYSSNPLSYAHHLYVNNKEVTELVIPNDVTSIKDYAFAGWSGLKSVNIGNSVMSIGKRGFSGCDGLISIVVKSGNKKYDSRDNCNAIVETANNTIIFGCKNTNIPSSITSIGDYAFSSCSGLTSITIPNSVTSIGEGAFRYCDDLTKVIFHTNEIGDWFRGVTSIKEIIIGDEVKKINNSAFYGCSGLTSVNIGNGVTSIGGSAFYGCSGLTSINIGNSVTSIGGSAFCECSNLTSVTIPNSVTSIEYSAFQYCISLRSITIPNSVTSIGNRAFGHCIRLTSVIIGNKVTSIGEDAFSSSYLTSIYCKSATPPSCSSGIFSYIYSNGYFDIYDNDKIYSIATLYVPIGSISNYKNTYPWKRFSNIVEVDN